MSKIAEIKEQIKRGEIETPYTTIGRLVRALEKARSLMIDEVEDKHYNADCTLMTATRMTIAEIETYDKVIDKILSGEE